jgi:hypothetical protein
MVDLASLEDGQLTADGFDEAIIGIGHRCGQIPLVVYDVEKCISILMEREGWPRDDAVEFFEFNTAGAWAGDGTPIWLYKMEDDANG